MSRHYYSIELVTDRVLDEDDVQELEEVIRLATQREARVAVEYVDSEG